MTTPANRSFRNRRKASTIEGASFAGNTTGRERGQPPVITLEPKFGAALFNLANICDPPKPLRPWYEQPDTHGHARSTQVPPDWNWLIWLILAGRGWGKTRTGAEWLAAQMLQFPGTFWIIGAPTFADGRDTCVEGESGLLTVLGGEDGPNVSSWNRSEGQITLKNGSRAKVFSGEEPQRFRGPNARGAWLDEFAIWKRLEDAWKMLRFTMRSGGVHARPQTVITTTPKAINILKTMLKRLGRITDLNPVATRRLPVPKDTGTLHLTLGSTFENRDNLAGTFIDEMLADFEGTRLGRQELYAEILDDVEGALWTDLLITRGRVSEIPSKQILDRSTNEYVDVMLMQYIVVAVDPAVSTGRHSDSVGIVVVGRGEDGDGYVLEDCTVHGKSPDQWANAVLDAYERWQADEVIGEVNNGGDLVTHTIKMAAQKRQLPCVVNKVNASRGKRRRAEPIVQLYEQTPPHMHHVGNFPRLEDQMTSFEPDISKWSPDRMDALVWGATRALGIGPGRRRRSAFLKEEAA